MSPDIPGRPSRHGAADRAASMLHRALKPFLARRRAVDDELIAHLADQERRLAGLERGGAGEGALDGGPADLGDVQYRVDVLERRYELAQARSLLADVPLPDEGMRRTVVAHDWKRGERRRVLCCGATGDHQTLLDVTGVTMVAYARRHRWDLVFSREHLAGQRPGAWNKIALAQDLLEDYAVVGWIDADAIIVDLTEDLGAELDDGQDFYLVAQRDGIPPTEVLNSGVFMVKDTKRAKRFLAEIWAQEDLIHHRWWENAAIMRLLGWDLDAEPVHPTGDTEWSDCVKFIDPAWNSIPWFGRAPRPRVNHYGGLAVPRRRLLMLDDLTSTVVRRRSSDPTAHVASREDLPVMLNRLGLIDVGVEVGVQTGAYSAWILHRWAGSKLISVDPWRADDPEAYLDVANVEQRRHDELHRSTTHRLAPFGVRSDVWRMTGAEAAKHVGDGSLSFVYLDARHAEADVAEDLTLWEPKVRPGGMVAGHDYFDGVVPEGDFGVKSAVDNYFGARGWTINETVGDRPWASWWVIKPPG
jgi:Methyltransferase domain/galactosyl transferase GMA12/MNN10 family